MPVSAADALGPKTLLAKRLNFDGSLGSAVCRSAFSKASVNDWKSASVGAPSTRIRVDLYVSSAVWHAEQFIPIHGSRSVWFAFQRNLVLLRLASDWQSTVNPNGIAGS